MRPFQRDHRLEPRRIAGVALDVVVGGELIKTEVASPIEIPQPQSMEKQNGDTQLTPITFTTTLTLKVRRNLMCGDEQKAMENLTHIDNPATASTPRATQARTREKAPTLTTTSFSKRSTELANKAAAPRAPHDHTAVVVQDITQLMVGGTGGDKECQVALGNIKSL
ncbi:MAG: hypothetical protein J3R72DRAFT_459604 [Linnemannia gamsii]|nr:MAG: hypothetical protein J3R72DRAFT_459604 [Linnemannia gamsii]